MELITDIITQQYLVWFENVKSSTDKVLSWYIGEEHKRKGERREGREKHCSSFLHFFEIARNQFKSYVRMNIDK